VEYGEKIDVANWPARPLGRHRFISPSIGGMVRREERLRRPITDSAGNIVVRKEDPEKAEVQ
jgi:hypothetical protein